MKTIPGVKVPYEKVDLIVVRENTEGLYAGLEHQVVPGVIESLRVITKPACERIVRYAFDIVPRASFRRLRGAAKRGPRISRYCILIGVPFSGGSLCVRRLRS